MEDRNQTDALLEDVKSLLGESDEAIAEQEPEEASAPAEEPMTADDVQIDYGKFYGEPVGQPQTPLTYYEQSKPAYQRARRAEYERIREQERMARAARQQELERQDEAIARQKRHGKHQPKPRRSAAEYAEWLYSQGLSDEEEHVRTEQQMKLAQPEKRQRPPKKEKPRRGGAWRVILVLVLLLAIGAAAFHFILARQPESDTALSARKPGCATILVAGTDEGGYRTDSMMLVNVDRETKAISLVSIPRDTLIYCEYSVPKINSAYGWAGGESGMQELLLRVSEIIGFEPDGYVVVDLNVFEQLVDLMGGITFEVPVDMHYNDPTQGLSIDLQAGKQHLNGNQAMQVARFRSGYATADLGRIEVQRDLVSAALRQWVSPKGLLHLPKALKLIEESSNTSLTKSNLLWLVESFLLCSRSSIRTATLPGAAANFSSGSYYVLDASGVAEMVNEYLNPYEKGVQADQLYIRAG